MSKLHERKLTPAELKNREDIIMTMKGNKRNLVKKYGKDAEAVMYGRATNIAKKQSESMKPNRLSELIKDSLKNPKAADLNKDGKLSDYEETRGAAIEKNINEGVWKTGTYKQIQEFLRHMEQMKDDYYNIVGSDAVFNGLDQAITGAEELLMNAPENKGELDEDLDLGHEDNEPHMLKADLYRIGKYSMELYNMVDEFDGGGEVDFPSWWQAKIFKAKDALVGAKHYLDFEINEPKIDAVVDTIDDITPDDDSFKVDDVVDLEIDENKNRISKVLEGLPKGFWDKKIDAKDEDQDGKVDESYATLVNKIEKSGKSEKAAKAIAGAVASYKAKGGGKGPTAKQK
tara:strand:- start:21 stop:1052 length:1032 start_codon:yes stop_codon:yes gene_type:complete